jgi:hypothetical protein
MWRSVPQIVDESIFTIASVGAWIVGSGASSQDLSPGPWYTRAFISRLLFLQVWSAPHAGGIGGVADRECGLFGTSTEG